MNQNTPSNSDGGTDSIAESDSGAPATAQSANSEATATAVTLEDLYKEFPSPDGGTITAVNGISLEIKDGEFFTFVGPSGCGKTTTLRMIAGLETPTSGSLYFQGEDVTDLAANDRNLAMMFQNIALYPHMKIKDNISYPLKVRNVPKSERYDKAADAAEVMQIPDLLEKHPAELSGGQRQRAALARTIVQDPVAFLMDEPLSDLDAKLQVEIRKEIQRVHNQVEKPTIYVTHNQEEAMTMSDRIAVLNDGEVAQVGTPEELYSEPANVFVAEFIGMPSMNFISGELRELDQSETTVSSYGETFTWGIEGIRREPSSDDVTIGFRPEATSLAKDEANADIEGEVQLLERIGDRLLAYIDGPEDEIRLTVDASDDIREGQHIPICIDTDGMYLFDRDTEELIACGQGA
ncbi:ABC transporter ATP-binding protein [Halorientalis sp. IM1011]|uniref:ABC transporter ATP-binding protein n=1 Tax=Halorientalis sp. IM1011 TaxID=1932360 RepID=UPI000A01276A|nr:ABC transporter ATP-binding protein [Halorientalis sp. IM1011]